MQDQNRYEEYDDPYMDPDEGAYAESYEQDPYYYPPQQQPRRGMSGWLIALIVVLVLIVVCCVCLCVGALLLGPAMGETFSTIVETLEVMTPVP